MRPRRSPYDREILALALPALGALAAEPLYVLVDAHAVNAVLEVVLVYGFGWGLAGSAWGTVVAQAGMGLAFLAVQRPAGLERPVPSAMRPLARIGSEIPPRTTAPVRAFLG